MSLNSDNIVVWRMFSCLFLGDLPFEIHKYYINLGTQLHNYYTLFMISTESFFDSVIIMAEEILVSCDIILTRTDLILTKTAWTVVRMMRKSTMAK